MNRRGFISGLLGAGAAMVLDPERALWVPGQKMVSIPKAIVAPPRQLFGFRLTGAAPFQAIPVFCDEVYLTEEVAAGTGFGKFAKIKTEEGEMSFWVQTQGGVKLRGMEIYSPSLAS